MRKKHALMTVKSASWQIPPAAHRRAKAVLTTLGDPDVQADLHNDEDAPQDDATDQANKTNDEA